MQSLDLAMTRFAALPLDMRSPPEGVTFPAIIGSDLMYIEAMVEPLAASVPSLMPWAPKMAPNPAAPRPSVICRR